MELRPIPYLHIEQARFGNADSRELIERDVAAIGFDLDVVQQSRRRTSGAQARKLLFERRNSALHATLEVIHVKRRCHGALPWLFRAFSGPLPGFSRQW